MKKAIPLCLAAVLLLTACTTPATQAPDDTAPPYIQENLVTREIRSDATDIHLSDSGITVNGSAVSSDPSAAVYTANDIVFYPEGQDFTYGEGTQDDAHSQEEADRHTVVHITKPGEYVLSGKLSAGQIAVDLGEDAKEDPNAVVTLVLNNADIACTVAPAVIFYNVYQCGPTDEDSATMEVDTSAAGANVIIADGSKNNIHGSYVAKIYKSVELNEDKTEVIDSKKLHKYDGAFYSKMTMNIYGEKESSGILNIYAENEGLDSELHLSIFSGNLHIESGNDGINTNEDNVSVTRILGGSLDIVVNGSTGEGDGIDSNGWLVIDGGALTVSACGFSGDAGIDADRGVHIRGGFVAAGGNMYDAVEGTQTYAVFTFSQRQKGGSTYTLKTEAGAAVLTCTPANDFQYLIVSSPDLTPGNYTLWQGQTQLQGSKGMAGIGNRPNMQPGEGAPTPPENMGDPNTFQPTPPEGVVDPNASRPTPPEGMDEPNASRPTPPEGMEKPEERPNEMGGFPGGNQSMTQESSAVFQIAEGANFFQISAA